jgi:putative ABC transport system permease protein
MVRPIIEARYGIYIELGGLTPHELLLLGIVLLSGFAAGLLPSYRAYRLSLADGLAIRI